MAAIGVVVALLTAFVPLAFWFIRRRRPAIDRSQQEASIEELKKHAGAIRSSYGKHKKRKKDGILVANISSDFLNQFPVPVGVMAAHLDAIYTPENFGAGDWISIFRRLTAEGYFVTADGSSPKRMKMNTPLNSGPKLESRLKSSAAVKRSIAGLD
jgi:hypothetical protein